ncbi:MAG: hypothetical protein U9R20_07525 [Thermodesulfobacteriota bacterium]|nr:hypothetical protein [Thermodesulfobacteriota bacterium]
MRKQGYLRPGAAGLLSWSRREKQTGSINYRMETGRMVLNYRHRPHGGKWENVQQVISFDWTPCNYGGKRTWFLCPNCNRRVGLLYGTGRYFLCRHCYNLTYASQQTQRYERLMEKARANRKRLGGGDDLWAPFPEKLKGMHWKTYQRLREEAEHANLLSLILGMQRLGHDMREFT